MMFKDNPEGQTQYEIPSRDSTEEMRREFETKCGVFDGTVYSAEKCKYIPAYYGETAYAATNNQNALFAGWQAAIASKQEELALQKGTDVGKPRNLAKLVN